MRIIWVYVWRVFERTKKILVHGRRNKQSFRIINCIYERESTRRSFESLRRSTKIEFIGNPLEGKFQRIVNEYLKRNSLSLWVWAKKDEVDEQSIKAINRDLKIPAREKSKNDYEKSHRTLRCRSNCEAMFSVMMFVKRTEIRTRDNLFARAFKVNPLYGCQSRNFTFSFL